MVTGCAMRLAPFSVLVLAIAACGGGSSTSGGSSGGTTGGGSTTGGSTTGGSTGGSGSTGGTTGGSSSGKPYEGFVIFGVTYIGTAKSYNGSAGFYTSTSLDPCTGGTKQGSCCYLSAAAAEAYGKSFPPADVSAGAVTLQDGSTTLASLPFVSGKGYTSVNSTTMSSVTWMPGDTLGVTAAGDASGVGSFSGTVTAPTRLGSVHPAIVSLSSISRSSDFSLTWTAAGSSTVTLTIIAAASGTADGLVRCTAPSSGGTLDVPSALLVNFKVNDNASVQLSTANNVTLSPSNATVGLSAEVIVTGSATLN